MPNPDFDPHRKQETGPSVRGRLPIQSSATGDRVESVLAPLIPPDVDLVGGISIAFQSPNPVVKWRSHLWVPQYLSDSQRLDWDAFEARMLRLVQELVRDEDWAKEDWIVEGRRPGYLLLLAIGRNFLERTEISSDDAFRNACWRAAKQLKEAPVVDQFELDALGDPRPLPELLPWATWASLTFLKDLFDTRLVGPETVNRQNQQPESQESPAPSDQASFSGDLSLATFVAKLSDEQRSELLAELSRGGANAVDPRDASAEQLSDFFRRLAAEPEQARSAAIVKLSETLQSLAGVAHSFADKEKISHALSEARKSLRAELLFEGIPCTISPGSQPKYGSGQYKISEQGGDRRHLHSPTRFPSGLSARPSPEG